MAQKAWIHLALKQVWPPLSPAPKDCASGTMNGLWAVLWAGQMHPHHRDFVLAFLLPVGFPPGNLCIQSQFQTFQRHFPWASSSHGGSSSSLSPALLLASLSAKGLSLTHMILPIYSVSWVGTASKLRSSKDHCTSSTKNSAWTI